MDTSWLDFFLMYVKGIHKYHLLTHTNAVNIKELKIKLKLTLKKKVK